MSDPLTEDGWHIWDMTEAGTWPSVWPPVHYRANGEGRMAIRAALPPRAGNLHGKVHGAFLAGLAEHVAGVFARPRDIPNVTISLAFDYPAAASVERPLTGTVELIRETGRLQFLRVTIDQQPEGVVVHGTVTIRKFAA